MLAALRYQIWSFTLGIINGRPKFIHYFRELVRTRF
jgi:hypothetical protein